MIVSSGALYNVDEDDTIQSLESAGNIDIANTKTLQTGDTGNNTISGVISGAGSLVKLGSGTLTLSGTNTNTGSRESKTSMNTSHGHICSELKIL